MNQCYSSVLQLYLDNSRKIHLWGVRARRSKDTKRRVPHRGERERESERTHTWERGRKRERECMQAWERERERERERKPFGSSFLCFFLPPGPVLCKLSLGRSAVLSEVLTPVLGPSFDLALLYFLGLFPSLSFSHRHFGLLFPILIT